MHFGPIFRLTQTIVIMRVIEKIRWPEFEF